MVLTDAIRLELERRSGSRKAPAANPKTTQGGLGPPAQNPILEEFVNALLNGVGNVRTAPSRQPPAIGHMAARLSAAPESVVERKLRRRQLTEDGNVEISGRD